MTSIFTRINQVITANLNDLIDRVEDPARMIKQFIREMEENIRQAKEGVLDAVTSEKQLQHQVEHHRKQSADWLAKAEQALKSDKEDLARSALARKKEHDNILADLEPSWQSAVRTSGHLKAQLHALEAKLEEARRKRATLVARQKVVQARTRMQDTSTAFAAGLRTNDGLQRMEDRVGEMEARSEALAEINQEMTPLEEEFMALEEDRAVEEELAALRSKLKDDR